MQKSHITIAKFALLTGITNFERILLLARTENVWQSRNPLDGLRFRYVVFQITKFN